MALYMQYKIWHFILSLIFCAVSVCSVEHSCSPGLTTAGYTVPNGDIVIEYGNPLNITCVLYENQTEKYGQNASQYLKFFRYDEPLPSDMIERINSTAIRLYIEKPPKVAKDCYYCKLVYPPEDNQVVCMNFVVIGNKPKPVTDFKCISYNYENLTCTWTPPENYVNTKYNLTFSLKKRAFRGPFDCPTHEFSDSVKGKMSCSWTIQTNPQYRQVQREFDFTLTAHNTFGDYQLNETFIHFQHVLSNPPINLSVLSTTPSSIYLYWTIPEKMVPFPVGVHHRVLYQCEYGKRQWHLAAVLTGEMNDKDFRYNLTDIKHPHCICDIRVGIRSAKALPDDESMWSRNTSITYRTQSRNPEMPPETHMGSFEIVSTGPYIQYRDAFVYWKQIADQYRNGPDFKYKIEAVGSSIEPSELTSSYAKYSNLLISHSYTFHIWSSNANGTSENYSVVHIPKQQDRISEPTAFTKVEYGDGIFELNWERPQLKEGEKISSYTIFWCNNDRDRPYQCSGLLNWKTISANHKAYNQTVGKNKIYQFAISANTENSTSGMNWAACTVIYNKSRGKINKAFIHSVNSTSIKLGWSLDCSNRIGAIEEYVIYYCPIKSPMQLECKGPQENQTIPGPAGTNGGTIYNLLPYTTYMITVAVKTKHTSYSQQSDPLFNTTLEAAPSTPPLNIAITHVSNSSISLSWQPPQATNGILKYYIINFNNRTLQMDPTDMNTTLPNLESYQLYHISMKACTISCSEYSQPISEMTLMGYPSKIPKPTPSTFSNNSDIKFSWSKPYPPRGKNDYYQVKIKNQKSGINNTLPILNITEGNSYTVRDCGEDSVYITVRAVNLIDGKEFAGPWSEELGYYCGHKPSIFLYIFIPCLLLIGAVFIFCIRWSISRWKIMRDVEVKLPPGLAPSTEWNPGKNSDRQTHTTTDEELLLVKMPITDTRHTSGDSSGCSSGHESVTSSLQSGSHLSSTSDSGTEQPRTPEEEEVGKTSLRLRNVGNGQGSRPTSKGYVSMPPDSVTPRSYSAKAAPGSYCMFGVDPNTSANTEPPPYSLTTAIDEGLKVPYISCDAGVQSSPYILADDLATKSVNPGYVPYVTDNTDKTPLPYVVAGNKNMLIPNLLNEALKPQFLNSEEKSPYIKATTDGMVGTNLTTLKTEGPEASWPWHNHVE